MTYTSITIFRFYISVAVQAVRSIWATRQLLLEGDFIGRPLRTLLEKADAKAWGAGTKNPIT